MEEDTFVATSVEMQIGIPLFSPNLELDLTPLDIQGKAFRDARKEACDKFLEDDTFVRSLTFFQLVWKMKIEEYKKIYEKKAQRLDRFDQENQEEVKSEMMEEFKRITVDEGRMIVSQARVLILPKLDIIDAVAFNAIRKSNGKQFSSEEEARLALKGLDFIDDYATLEIWALEGGPRKPNISDLNPNLRGGLIVKRASDTSSVEDTKLNVGVAKLAHETSKREALEKIDLRIKFDKIFNDYNATQ